MVEKNSQLEQTFPHHKEITTLVSLNSFDLQKKEIIKIMPIHAESDFVYDDQRSFH